MHWQATGANTMLAAGKEQSSDEQSLTKSVTATVAAVLVDAVSCSMPGVNAIAVRQISEVLLKR